MPLPKPTKRDIKKALKDHVKGLQRSIKAKEQQIKDLQSHLARIQEEHDDLRKACALASKNLSKFESENPETPVSKSD